MKINGLLLFVILSLAMIEASGQLTIATEAPASLSVATLKPLTVSEQTVDLKNILAKQPDFAADDLIFYTVDGHTGVNVKTHFERLGNLEYEDNGIYRFLYEPNKWYRIDSKAKTFEEIPVEKTFLILLAGHIDPPELARQKSVTFAALGTQLVDGHKCIKIEVKASDGRFFYDDGVTHIFLYAAVDLKYLIIASEGFAPPSRSLDRLQNISLVPKKELFRIPADYKRLPEPVKQK